MRRWVDNFLRKRNSSLFCSLSEIEIQESITIKQNEEVENQFVLFDSEEEEEAIISTYTVSVLDYFKDSIANLPNNTPVRFSCDLDILLAYLRYHGYHVDETVNPKEIYEL